MYQLWDVTDGRKRCEREAGTVGECLACAIDLAVLVPDHVYEVRDGEGDWYARVRAEDREQASVQYNPDTVTVRRIASSN